MKSNYHKYLLLIYGAVVGIGGYYITGNQPDGELLATLILLAGMVVTYPVVLYFMNTQNLIKTILIHLILLTATAIIALHLRTIPLAEMGALIYYLYPVGITVALFISYPIVIVLKKINKPKQD